jgi:hypothetical protein
VLTEINCPEPVVASYFVDPNVGYLFLRNGNVLRTADRGQTFSRVTAIPTTPESAGGGTGVPADAIFSSPDAGIVFIAGTNRAYRTTDAGQSWQPMTRGLPQQDAYVTVLRDAFTAADDGGRVGLYFGTRGGEVYASHDDGESWRALAEHLPPVLSVRAATLA